jgi:hypothetical protein
MKSSEVSHAFRQSSTRVLIALLCLAVFAWVAVPRRLSAQSAERTEHPVEIRFVQSPYADYLYYLLYRNTGSFSELETAVPLGKIPSLGFDRLVSLAEQAASAQVQRYGELFTLVDQYRDAREPVLRLSVNGAQHFRKLGYSYELPSYQQLTEIVRQGEASYPAFLGFWKEHIAPAEQQQIASWERQLVDCDPMRKLQQIERLSFPFEHLDIAAMALHLSGSGNTYPPGVYTSLFKKANLPWAVGHEATHLMLDRYSGHNWLEYPMARQAREVVRLHGGTDPEIEESLCLFMQLKLSQSCGYDEASRRISERFDANVPKGAILRSLEAGWDKYQASPAQDIIGYMLQQTIVAFPAPAK